MKIANIMTQPPQYVNADTTVTEAAGIMRDFDLGFLPIEKADRMVGMLTDRDIAVRVVAEGRDPDEVKVREVMTGDVLYCFDDQEVDDAANIMAERKIRRLPVVNRDKRLVGIVSLGDVSKEGEPELAGHTLETVARAP
ncbi:MAG: CBS domain-containing protein [Geminicoccales bacterium]